MYVLSNQSKMQIKLIWQPKVIGFDNGFITNKIACQMLSLTRKWVSVASRQPNNVINHKKFYFTINQNQIPNNLRPYPTLLYSSRARNMKINQTAALHKNFTSHYNHLLEKNKLELTQWVFDIEKRLLVTNANFEQVSQVRRKRIGILT
jgi:hypothetical protein